LGSGRTDKDVHATNQVLHTFIPSFWSNNLDKLRFILNKNLPNSINIKSIKIVSNNFHSRFSAKKRAYRYIVSTKPTNVFNSKYLTYIPKIDIKKIQEAIKLFVGIHDFHLFRKIDKSITNTTREIFNAKFYKHKDLYIFYFEANAYLRSQIRIMVNFLFKISDNKLTIDNLKEQLANKKLYSNTLAPANGLYLTRIKY
jgi:tRNA pseudouridine38-40 synthase